MSEYCHGIKMAQVNRDQRYTANAAVEDVGGGEDEGAAEWKVSVSRKNKRRPLDACYWQGVMDVMAPGCCRVSPVQT